MVVDGSMLAKGGSVQGWLGGGRWTASSVGAGGPRQRQVAGPFSVGQG